MNFYLILERREEFREAHRGALAGGDSNQLEMALLNLRLTRGMQRGKAVLLSSLPGRKPSHLHMVDSSLASMSASR
jgi:hypothetical protein